MKLSERKLLDEVEKAWLDRWNHRMEPAYLRLCRLQQTLDWNDLNIDHLDRIPAARQHVFQELALLKNSLLRAQGNKKKSSSQLAKIQRTVQALNLRSSFRLEFELAIDHWVDNHAAQALEHFLRAEQLAQNAIHKIYISVNILLCLEALDFERGARMSQIEEQLESLPSKLMPAVENAVHQINAYELRRCFYTNLKLPELISGSQATFFKDWVEALPYYSGQKRPQKYERFLWEGSYRLRTLASIWIASDQYGIRMSDAIDRLYLWVWKLLVKWSDVEAEYCSQTLNYILEMLETENQSKEDLLLLRNAIAWFNMLFPHARTSTHSLFKSLSTLKSDNYPVLEAEFDFHHWLKGEIAGSKSPGSLRQILIWRYTEFHNLAKTWRDRLKGLSTRLDPQTLANTSANVIVDLTSTKIILIDKNRTFVSPALSEFFQELVQAESIKIVDYEKFDVLNLIYRTRKMFGKTALLVAGGCVSLGPDWPKIQFIDRIGPALNSVNEQTPSFSESKAYLQAAKALFVNSFKRRELEKKMKVSKATANRMLKAWMRENYIVQSGNSKSSIYTWRRDNL